MPRSRGRVLNATDVGCGEGDGCGSLNVEAAHAVGTVLGDGTEDWSEGAVDVQLEGAGGEC